MYTLKTHLLLLFLLLSGIVSAQVVTGISGTVVDARSGEPLPFVNVFWVGTNQGMSTDTNGHFELSNSQGLVTVAVRYIGYKSQIITLTPGKTVRDVRVKMERDNYDLNEVKITAKRTKYVRKGNPAVELIEKVIAHKNDNRAESREAYKVDVYEKLTMAIDGVDIDYERTKLLSKFSFLHRYIDTTQFNGTPLLTVSLRETKADEYYRSHGSLRRNITAQRMQGLDVMAACFLASRP